ncbi:MAG: DUF6270 domain-containing protein, partial [Arcanobacterium sp.]|nr:DUF6270 domain-containing protein [Arcanobacterium sp.]
QPDLFEVITQIVSKIAQYSAASHIVALGGSGGGYASLRLIGELGGTAVVMNPQTDIYRYVSDAVEAYRKNCWSADSGFSPEFTHDIFSLWASEKQDGLIKRVLYLQNQNDATHIQDHLKPFLNVLKNSERAKIIIRPWAEGHTPPPKHVIRRALEWACTTSLADAFPSAETINSWEQKDSEALLASEKHLHSASALLLPSERIHRVLPLDQNGNGIIRGVANISDSQRVLVGLLGVNHEETVRGMAWSTEGGFWFQYVKPDPVSKKFVIPVQWCNSSRKFARIFFQHWYSQGEVEISTPNLKEPPKIFIYGSCVSADIMNYPDAPQHEYYFARSSLLSSMSDKPSLLYGADLSRNPSNFQRKMIQRDLNRELQQALPATQADLIVVDFIDERLDLLSFDGGGLFTKSPELMAAKLDLNGSILFPTVGAQYYELFSHAWLKFKELCGEKPVLINKVFWATHDDAGNERPRIEWTNLNNEKLSCTYDIVNQLTPDVHWLTHRASSLVGKTDHRWGSAPFHFVDTFDQEVIDGIYQAGLEWA